MAKINLLPWRDERRQLLKKQFLVILAGMVVFAAVIVLGTQRYYAYAIEGQQGRNQYLEENIAVLDKQVKEINQLEERKQALLERMQIIQDLQGKRPLIVRIFDEITRTVPDGTFFRSLTRTEAKISVQGIAESNNRVSSLMRNLDSSLWFASPNLTAVNAVPEFGDQASQFSLSYSISAPEEDKQEE